MTFLWDPTSNLLHIDGCPHAHAEQMVSCTLDKCLRKNYSPCSCCRALIRQGRLEKNRHSIQQARFLFVYTPNSTVYHRPDCPCILRAKCITGKQNYDKMVETGRRPCKRFKPASPAPLPSNKKVQTADKTSAYPFGAEKGHRTFHLATCKSLSGLTQLHGYARYRSAIAAGLRPCRHCRPTAKYDPAPVIPVCGTQREGETIQAIVRECQKSGFYCERHKRSLLIVTPVGRWQMNIKEMPITLGHINLVNKCFCRLQPIFPAGNALFFLDIHKVCLRKTAFSRRKISG